MPDNLGYTPGTGATVSTEEVTTLNGSAVTAQHLQRIAMGISTANGVGIDLPGDATNGLDVDVTRVSGRVQVGDASNTVAIDATPTDGETNTANLLYTADRMFVFNGTSWDRARGDTTNGLDVDVTRVQGSVTVAQATAANLNATVTGTVGVSSLPALVAGTAYVGRVRVTDGTNDLSIDTVHGDGESATENHLDVQARMSGLNNAGTFDIQRVNTTNFRCATYATAQTGVALWTPAAGRAVCITALQIQSYGTTAGTCIVWWGGAADTTYTRGTDAPLFDGEFAPSATSKPGVYITFPTHCRGAADFVLRVTTTNAQSVTVNVWGYEL